MAFRTPTLTVNETAHIAQLNAIVAKLLEANICSPAGAGIYLHLRTIRGQKDAEGIWHHEFRLETTDPFADEED